MPDVTSVNACTQRAARANAWRQHHPRAHHPHARTCRLASFRLSFSRVREPVDSYNPPKKTNQSSKPARLILVSSRIVSTRLASRPPESEKPRKPYVIHQNHLITHPNLRVLVDERVEVAELGLARIDTQLVQRREDPRNGRARRAAADQTGRRQRRQARGDQHQTRAHRPPQRARRSPAMHAPVRTRCAQHGRNKRWEPTNLAATQARPRAVWRGCGAGRLVRARASCPRWGRRSRRSTSRSRLRVRRRRGSPHPWHRSRGSTAGRAARGTPRPPRPGSLGERLFKYNCGRKKD